MTAIRANDAKSPTSRSTSGTSPEPHVKARLDISRATLIFNVTHHQWWRERQRNDGGDGRPKSDAERKDPRNLGECPAEPRRRLRGAWIRKEALQVTDLVEAAFEAHGGRDRWERLKRIEFDLDGGGLLLELRRNPEALRHQRVAVDMTRPHVVYHGFTGEGRRGVFTPERVWIEESDGSTLPALDQPRASFAELERHAGWSDLQVLYFGGYAIWNYTLGPLLFLQPGASVKEIEPWREDGETWRRLSVRLPDGFHTHTPQQTFYFDENFLLRRLDYHVDIVGEVIPTVHYLADYQDVEGVKLALRRFAVPRNPDGTRGDDLVFMRLNLSDAAAAYA